MPENKYLKIKIDNEELDIDVNADFPIVFDYQLEDVEDLFDDFVQALYNCISTPCDMCDHFNVTYEILICKILSIIHDEVKYTTIKNNFKEKEVPYEACCI